MVTVNLSQPQGVEGHRERHSDTLLLSIDSVIKPKQLNILIRDGQLMINRVATAIGKH